MYAALFGSTGRSAIGVLKILLLGKPEQPLTTGDVPVGVVEVEPPAEEPPAEEPPAPCPPVPITTVLPPEPRSTPPSAVCGGELPLPHPATAPVETRTANIRATRMAASVKERTKT